MDDIRDEASAGPAAGGAVRRAEAAEAELTTGLVGRYRRHPLVRGAGTVSEIADQPQLLAVCAGVAAWGLATGDGRLARCGGHMLASFLLATWAKGAAKGLVTRSRPNMLAEHGVHEAGLAGRRGGPWSSFPSGHSAGAAAAARAVARHYPSAAVPAYVAAAGVAAAQVPRCAHYPSDVAAGVLVGLAAEAAAARLLAALARTGRSAPARDAGDGADGARP